jgi:hypothetical protein
VRNGTAGAIFSLRMPRFRTASAVAPLLLRSS